jgi:hypothetical protein
MAEIRKFDPAAGNAIAQALKAAMGEPVRPREPGSAPNSPSPEPKGATTSWVSLQVASPTEESDED